jgi:hypothetical protein
MTEEELSLLPGGNEVLLWSILTDSGAHQWMLGTLTGDKEASVWG